MSKTAVVTGGTSGIGKACAEALAKSGYKVYTVSRNSIIPETEGIISITADVTMAENIKKAYNKVFDEEKRLDLLVNCAGFGISGALEFTDPADAHRQLEVNLFGVDNSCKAAIPLMRSQGFGRIINISSVAAVIAIPFQGWYSISKAGINAYTLALANELRPFGISVTALMPGDVKTGFTDARQKDNAGEEIYNGIISRSVSHMEKDERNGMSPQVLGKRVLRIAELRHVKPLYSSGIAYKSVCVLSRLLPCSVVNRLVFALYCK